MSKREQRGSRLLRQAVVKAVIVSLSDRSVDALGSVATERTRELIDASERARTRAERSARARFSGLLRDPGAIDVTIVLTDEVMRAPSASSAATLLREAVHHATRRGFGVINAVGLRAVGVLAKVSPRVAMAVVHQQVRTQSRLLILPAEEALLGKHVSARANEGVGLNINVLGEAVLGEGEAHERLARVLEMMNRPEVSYVSVKLSSMVSQLITWDEEGSLERVLPVLRTIYRQARQSDVFVNLDMEEFRDLALTTRAFQTVLDEPEFIDLTAGIVLQAYLPESHDAFATLATWAQTRHARSGASIKVRLVKGANLAMEEAEAQLHGWTAAPFATKAAVDASYLRLVDLALRPEIASAVRIGIASHNLFHVNWARLVAHARGVSDQVDIEMLEGMANAEVRALVRDGQPVLLYAPVTRHDDFAAAIAYLVRRLDENTAPENYLSAAFFIAHDPAVFADQRDRFLTALEERHTLTTASRRHGAAATHTGIFANERDGDPSNPVDRTAVRQAFATVRTTSYDIPLVVAGEERRSGDQVDGRDPSNNGEVWYRYDVARLADVDDAVRSAQQAQWGQVSASERAAVLRNVAALLRAKRPTLTGVMSRDAGKTIGEADPEISEAIDFAEFYATLATDGDSVPSGVVAVVPPWNFPLAIPAGGVFAALAAGNSVLLKPAPETVATAWHLVDTCWRAGVPKDALQFVPTRDDEVGQALITHEGVSAVILTGSFETAQLFSSWKPSLRLLGETSGKNAILITRFADLDLAVKDLVSSAFGHAGQKCSAASLGIVERELYESPMFLRQLRDAVASLRVGPGYDLSTVVGPLISPPGPALRRALTTLDDGESWLIAPEQRDEQGYLWSPGVKLGTAPGSWSHQNEWFGPVLAIMVAPDYETGLAWQNDTPYGLTAGLHSLNEAECAHWTERVEAGNLYVNRGTTGAVVNRQPFGGWKRSSVGATAKAGGRHYVDGLREWAPLADPSSMLTTLATWFREVGQTARDEAGLTVERNVQRYRRPLDVTTVRVDESTPASVIETVRALAAVMGLRVEISGSAGCPGDLDVREDAETLVSRARGRVRWLSAEPTPTAALLARGVMLDTRPLAARGDVEGPRWLLEQSVSVTAHRYGNVNAGPKPTISGLG